MGQIICDAFRAAIEYTETYWDLHKAGYFRVFIAVVIFGIVGSIVVELYERYEKRRQRKMFEKDDK